MSSQRSLTRYLFLLFISLEKVLASSPANAQTSFTSTLTVCPVPIQNGTATTENTPPLWTLKDWSTDYTVEDGGSIIFRLVNNLTGYDALCFRRGPYPEGYCVQAITDGGEGTGTEEDTTGTIFEYYDKIGLLEIYQEWDCDGGANNTMRRVQADGKLMILSAELCKAGEEMMAGKMCGSQGGGGKILPARIQID
ncbi:hypothetical protein V8F06_008873 [Rhypophila decipiens]